MFVHACLFSSPCVRADGRNLHSSLPGEGKSDTLLIVRSLIYEERVERFFPFVAQCFPWERQEHGVSRVEKTEIPILREERGCLPAITLSDNISSNLSTKTESHLSLPAGRDGLRPWSCVFGGLVGSRYSSPSWTHQQILLRTGSLSRETRTSHENTEIRFLQRLVVKNVPELNWQIQSSMSWTPSCMALKITDLTTPWGCGPTSIAEHMKHFYITEE